MIYLLDTDISIYLLNGREPRVKRNADLVSKSEIAISTLTLAEMFSGAARSEQFLLTYANSRHSSCAIRFCRLTKPQREYMVALMDT